MKSEIQTTTLNYNDTLSSSSHSYVIINSQELDRYIVALDVEKTDDNEYSARKVIVCHPVETEDGFESIFIQKIIKVNLSAKNIDGMLSNTLVLKDGTRISKDWTINFDEPKSYEDTDRFVKILQSFLEFMMGSHLDLKTVMFSTEDLRSITYIFPKPLYKQLSVPSRREVKRMFASAQVLDDDEHKRVLVILGVWTHFFLENSQHAFLESMPSVMQPYEHKVKNKIISDRVDFLVGMIKVVFPNKINDINGNVKSATKLLKEMLEQPTTATQLQHRSLKNIIERCKNIRNLVVHKIRDSRAQTNVSNDDYDIFETFFYQSFSYLMIQFMEPYEKSEENCQ